MNKCQWAIPCHNEAKQGQYCDTHNRALGIKPEKVKKVTPIKKVSDKEKSRKAELKKMYPVFLAEKKFICEIQSPECTKTATAIHHLKGREGEQVFETLDWLACCQRCNGYVEEHDKWARDKGFKLNKHSNND